MALVGSGLGALSTAVLLAKAGLQVTVLEQNKYPGGCASTYKRKGFWFETGATTLVGLDEHMPLRYVLDQTGIELPVKKLETPMQVRLLDGTVVTRHQELEEWISEAERVFGEKGQRGFWESCFHLSQKVWETSLRQTAFPFSSLADLWEAAKSVQLSQVSLLPKAFFTVQDLLRDFGLLENERFVSFIDQQLLITAQNDHTQVNQLFGATALCYTQYGNYYLPGGLRKLAEALVTFLENHQGEMLYKEEVCHVRPTQNGHYEIQTKKRILEAEFVVLGVPLNNVAQLFDDLKTRQRLEKHLLPSEKLHSALTWGICFQRLPGMTTVLHHQIHVPGGVPYVGSASIFVSFSDPQDFLRAPEGFGIASVSTHVPDPANNWITLKKELERWVVEFLASQGFFTTDQVQWVQAATPGAWIDWTSRAFGQVGGYPQFKDRKPWQLKDARLDHNKAYLCGDTVYPGQGIPGVCLSGIIAAKKLLRDHFPQNKMLP